MNVDHRIPRAALRCFLASCLMATSVGAAATETVPPLNTLTLTQAYTLALQKDAAYAAALAAYRALQERVPQARAALRPNLALSGALTASASRPGSNTTLNETATEQIGSSSSAQTSSRTVETSNTSGAGSARNTSGTSDATGQSDSSRSQQDSQQDSQQLETANALDSRSRVNGLNAKAELNLSWPIYRPGLQRALEQSQLIEDQALVQLEAARQDIALRVAQAYLDVILSNENMVAIAVQKESIALQLDVAENNFKEGVTTIADVREAQAKRDALLAQEVAQRNTQKIKLSALQAIIGQRPQALQQLRAEELLAQPPELGPMERWVERAREQAYAVRIETLGFLAADKEVAKQSDAHKPTLDFVANLGLGRTRERSVASTRSQESESISGSSQSQSSTTGNTRTSTDLSGGSGSTTTSNVTSSRIESQTNSQSSTQTTADKPVSRSSFGRQLDAYIGVRLNVQLFDGGLTSSRVREALALKDKQEATLARIQAEAVQVTETAYLESVGYFAEAQALQAAVRSGEVALESNQLGYEVGVRISADVLNAQQQLFTVRRDLKRALVDALAATLRLRASAAGLGEDEVMGLGMWLK